MAEVIGTVGSIISIADFGLKFAMTLQTYIVTVADSQESLRDIAFDVSATATALEQLHEFVKTDQNGKTIANDSGLEQVVKLASQCKQVYTAIFNLIAKAAGVQLDSNSDASLNDVDLNNLKASSLMQKLKWPFKEPRIKKHQEELRWLKISLLFHLQLMQLAKTKMTAPAKLQTSLDDEAAVAATLVKLLERKEAYTKRMVMERKKKKKRRKAKMKAKEPSKAPSTNTIDEGPSESSNLDRKMSPALGNDSPTSEIILMQNLSPDKIDNKEEPSKSDLNLGIPTRLSITSRILANVPTEKFGANSMGGMEPQETTRGNITPENPGQESKSQIATNKTNNRPSRGRVRTQDSIFPARHDVPEKESTHPDANNGTQHPSNHTTEASGNSNTLEILQEPFRALLLGFSKLRKPFDWESEELVAYLIEEQSRAPARRLPLGHQKLTDMLRQAMKSRKNGVWAQHASLSAEMRKRVDETTENENSSSLFQKICVGISPHRRSKDAYVVIYLTLPSIVRPIHLKAGTRYYQFPFYMCRTWADMISLITQRLADLDYVRERRYRLKGPDDRIITSTTWKATIHPGFVVFLHAISVMSAIKASLDLEQTDYYNPPAPPPHQRIKKKERRVSSIFPQFGRMSWPRFGRRRMATRGKHGNAPSTSRLSRAHVTDLYGPRIEDSSSDGFPARISEPSRVQLYRPPVPLQQPRPATENLAITAPPSSPPRKKGKKKKKRRLRLDEFETPTMGDWADEHELVLESGAIPGGGQVLIPSDSERDEEEEEEDDDDDDDEGTDIIDFEAEEQGDGNDARLGLGGLLGKWTNAVG